MSLQEQLYDLYLLDKNVRGLRRRLDAATDRQRVQQTRLEQLQQQKTELTDQLKHAKAHQADQENQAQGVEQKIENLRQQMNTVKNNKEYSAVLIEVNTFKAEKSKIEEIALEDMAKVELLEAEVKALTEKTQEQQKLVDAADREVADAQAEVGEKLKELETQRDQATAELSEAAQLAFKRASAVTDGDAMAEVVEENRRAMDYSCGGCYMSIPIEKLNSLMVNADEIVVCNTCGRILFVDKELKTSLTPK